MEEDELRDSGVDAGAVAIRVGEQHSNGFSEWKVVVRIRHAAADYDAVYTARWVSEAPPGVLDIMRHYQARPQDFEFLDFRPNPNKQG